jgi:acetoacetate decarboxylase
MTLGECFEQLVLDWGFVSHNARWKVREVVSALHFKTDLTLGLGTVAFDYLAK